MTGNPAEDAEIQTEVEKVSEESKVHDPVRHPFKYPTDRVASVNKKISISIKYPNGMKNITYILMGPILMGPFLLK